MHTRLKNLNFSASFAELSTAFLSFVKPTALTHPASLVHFNPRVARLLGFEADIQHDADFLDLFSGAKVFDHMQPFAMLYAGHQFGHYVPQLGDGRAITLGEVSNHAQQTWEIQLKGSGLTPYSRDGDGRAVLRSTIREYLCSEAMHGLGIPTTHALCLAHSPDEVYREQIETAAVLTRVAPSHVRFGSFEVFFYRNQPEHIRTLADYVIDRHYPELRATANPYLALLESIVTRTAKLMAQWQCVGFAHGVMNTDNMSVLGLTLDYGPFGFMEAYDPDFICNHSDYQGRYAFRQQPRIGLWNLTCLAQALTPLIDVYNAKAALEAYQPQYSDAYHQGMLAKLGLATLSEDAVDLLNRLLTLMQDSRADYTRTFRLLSRVSMHDTAPETEVRDLFIDRRNFDTWLNDYRAELRRQDVTEAQRQAKMNRCNPKYVLRNYMAQIAIDKATRENDYSEIDRLIHLLQSPCDEHPDLAHYAEPPPDWAENIQVSCSS